MGPRHDGDVDLVNACRAFVAVAELGSFTRGAGRVGTSQSVASRRVAALERHVGELLLVRDSARTEPTAAGLRLLPHARTLVADADRLEAAMAVNAPTTVVAAVPEDLDPRDVAAAHVAAHDRGLLLRLQALPPARRRDLVAGDEVDAAVLPRPADAAEHSVPLGIASAVRRAPRARVEHLRPRRGAARAATLWLTPEDDVAHVRDRLVIAAEQHALVPGQVRVATTTPEAVASALVSDDVVVMSEREARRHDLVWSGLVPALTRGHAVTVTSRCPSAARRDLAGCLAELVRATADGAA